MIQKQQLNNKLNYYNYQNQKLKRKNKCLNKKIWKQIKRLLKKKNQNKFRKNKINKMKMKMNG